MLSNKITEEMDYNIFKNYFFLFSFTMKQETIYYIYAGKAIFVWNTRLYDFTSINNKTLVMYDNIVSLHRFWLRINLNIINLGGGVLFGSFFFKGGEAVILLWKYFRIPPDVQSTQILIFFFILQYIFERMAKLT